MNTDEIDKAFKELINERGVHNRLGIDSNKVRQLRTRVNNNTYDSPVSLDTKIALLQKSGWRQSQANYTHADLVAAVKYAIKKSAMAKEMGAEYITEQFLKRK